MKLTSLICTFLFSSAILLITATVPEIVYAQICDASEIRGYIFRDYDNNGARDNSEEPGVSGVTVTGFSQSEVALSSTLSKQDGSFSLVLPAGTKVRLEIDGFPSYLKHAPHGVSSQTSTTFATAGSSCNVAFALHNPAQYCPSPAQIATSCFAFGSSSGPNGALDSVISLPEDGGASNSLTSSAYDLPMHKMLAPVAEVGSVWALAHYKQSGKLFAGSFIRRHAGLGPTGNPTTIYSIDISTSVATPWLTIDPTRADPHTGISDSAAHKWARDYGAFAAVFKEGIGDIEISDDGSQLYAVDLGSRQLVTVVVKADGSAGSVSKVDITQGVKNSSIAKDCAKDGGQVVESDIRPFGLGYKDDQLYLGIVCSGQSSVNEASELPIEAPGGGVIPQPPGDASLLHGYVFSWNGTTFNEVVKFPLNYNRSCQMNAGATSCSATSAKWTSWVDTYPFYDNAARGKQFDVVYPQPAITDIAFDKSGMIIGVGDRFGFQFGQNTWTPSHPNNLAAKPEGIIWYGIPAGDVLRACGNGSSFTLEQQISGDATCQTLGKMPSDNLGSQQNEYYFEDDFRRDDNTYGDGGVLHYETTLGAVLQIPGRSDVIASAFDPIRTISRDASDGDTIFDNGLVWLSREHGSFSKAYRVYNGTGSAAVAYPFFDKAAGLGGLDAICALAPIEIGNRVWLDLNKDGVQGAEESPLSSVVLKLYDLEDDGKQIGEIRTDTNGEYYFGGVGNSNLFSGVVLKARHKYRIAIEGNDTALEGREATVSNTNTMGSDFSDSDGVLSGTQVSAEITTGAEGENDHSIDFGFNEKPVDQVPDCKTTSIANQLILMDGSGARLAGVARRALAHHKRFSQAKFRGNSKLYCRPYSRSTVYDLYSATVGAHYRRMWQATWSIPATNTVCSNFVVPLTCASVSTTRAREISDYSMQRINSVVNKVLARCANSGSKERLITRSIRELKRFSDSKLIVPDAVLKCQ